MISKAIESLGFDRRRDYRLEDHLDGKGVQIVWLSDKPKPSDNEIAEARRSIKG